VTQILNLLSLDGKIKEVILALDETDEKLGVLTECRLRCLIQIKDSQCQEKEFLKLIRD
jgi:hypothetical protein